MGSLIHIFSKTYPVCKLSCMVRSSTWHYKDGGVEDMTPQIFFNSSICRRAISCPSCLRPPDVAPPIRAPPYCLRTTPYVGHHSGLGTTDLIARSDSSPGATISSKSSTPVVFGDQTPYLARSVRSTNEQCSSTNERCSWFRSKASVCLARYDEARRCGMRLVGAHDISREERGNVMPSRIAVGLRRG